LLAACHRGTTSGRALAHSVGKGAICAWLGLCCHRLRYVCEQRRMPDPVQVGSACCLMCVSGLVATACHVRLDHNDSFAARSYARGSHSYHSVQTGKRGVLHCGCMHDNYASSRHTHASRHAERDYRLQTVRVCNCKPSGAISAGRSVRLVVVFMDLLRLPGTGPGRGRTGGRLSRGC